MLDMERANPDQNGLNGEFRKELVGVDRLPWLHSFLPRLIGSTAMNPTHFKTRISDIKNKVKGYILDKRLRRCYIDSIAYPFHEKSGIVQLEE